MKIENSFIVTPGSYIIDITILTRCSMISLNFWIRGKLFWLESSFWGKDDLSQVEEPAALFALVPEFLRK